MSSASLSSLIGIDVGRYASWCPGGAVLFEARFPVCAGLGLASAVAAEHLPIEPPKESGPEWMRGFSLGSDNIKSRVEKAVESEGSEAAARVLNQPLGP